MDFSGSYGDLEVQDALYVTRWTLRHQLELHEGPDAETRLARSMGIPSMIETKAVCLLRELFNLCGALTWCRGP